eukprot:762914-Hanusia_phi.AAC.1
MARGIEVGGYQRIYRIEDSILPGGDESSFLTLPSFPLTSMMPGWMCKGSRERLEDQEAKDSREYLALAQ